MSTNKVVSLAGDFQIGDQIVKGLDLDTSTTKIRFNEQDKVVVVIGINTQGKLVKAFADAADALLQQLDHLGSKRAEKDMSIRMPKAFA